MPNATGQRIREEDPFAKDASRDNIASPQNQEGLTPPTERSGSESATIDHEHVARRAYERFEARGGEHGRDQEDWLQAERDVAGRASED